MCSCYVFFFFFQAEDGIRDLTVTGVQTCALPISPAESGPFATRSPTGSSRSAPRRNATASSSCSSCARQRSEEHTSELQSQSNLVCRLLLEKKKKNIIINKLHNIFRHTLESTPLD